ncbi:hypothetical protein EK21DRAFT_85253 [Setomelanomma holmii]|uniref:RapZ C-terminal domain-containing protein n=1 Tax=Setomelanomma holmii TaxID=210430 RepID=A0A9P4LRS5_9PLEO|nr:hypothetical protein EK21DRAFT_85253 [Setomelanomma holmii]
MTQPLLILYSHGRTPPLHPPPDLKYDLRDVSSPPKALRDASDGRSKRLREHLLSDEKFMQKLGEVERNILDDMERKIKDWDADKDAQGGEEEEEHAGTTRETRRKVGLEDGDKDERDLHGADDEGEVDDEDEEPPQYETHEQPPKPTLRVGCFCALGHHRSVAFVEELARRKWPKEWGVEVVHRDLERRKGGGKREGQRRNWRGRDRGGVLCEDEDG